MSISLLSMTIRYEQDVVAVRQKARQVAAAVGFDGQDQTRIATAISELARNAFMYARGGAIEFLVEGERAPQLLVIRVSDRGPGIADVDAVLSGRYRSQTGMGLGMAGARRLVDRFEVTSSIGEGTTVMVGKLFSRRAPALDAAALRALAGALAKAAPQSPIEEIRQQNQELIGALEQLRQRQEDLSRLNAELEDTNRGVVALYAELDEKAETLRRADEIKSRFLSHMSHEFRTPLNSMRALSALLLDDRESPLTAEQRRQVGYIRQAADDLSELVNDLLDLAAVEAGKTVVRPAEFDLRNLFAALRGMLRPLLVNESVALVFEEPEDVPLLRTDEGKVSQILRNFLSNALKFTERGEIRVTARLAPDGTSVVCSVADTGMGIAAEDQERIFEEFTQVDNPVQKRVRGTGLGLPLVRKLATLLGGHVSVESTLGLGSTFTATIPLVYVGAEAQVSGEPVLDPVPIPELVVDTRRSPRVLVIDDDEIYRYLVRTRLGEARFIVQEAAGGAEGLLQARAQRPHAIVLDLVMPEMSGFEVLAQLKEDPVTADIPVVVLTSKILSGDEQRRLAPHAARIVSKETLSRPDSADHLLEALSAAGLEREPAHG
jgi:signal transduction histidine kinase/ActR/RegA family two-component response regulator